MLKKISRKITRGDRLLFLFLSLGMFLSMTFFLPDTSLIDSASKGFFYSLFALVIFIATVSLVLFRNRFSFSSRPFLYSVILLVVPLSLLLFLTNSFSRSFLGSDFSPNTYIFLFSSIVYISSAPFFVNSERRITTLLFLPLIVFLIAASLSFLQVSGVDIFSGEFINPVGSWAALSVLAGLMFVFVMVSLEFFKLNKTEKVLSYILAILSLLIFTLVRNEAILVAVGLTSLSVISLKTLLPGHREARAPFYAFFSIILVALLLFVGGYFSNFLGNTFGLSFVDIRPSFSSTTSVIKSSWGGEGFLVGSGINSFSNSWNLYRPEAVISSDIAFSSFSNGFGYIMTLFGELGLIVGVALTIFLIHGLIMACRVSMMVVSDKSENRKNIFLILPPIMMLYSFAILLLYSGSVPTVALFVLSYALVLSSQRFLGIGKTFRIDISKDPRLAFVSMIFGIFLSIFAVFSIAGVSSRMTGNFFYQKAINSARAGNLDSYYLFTDKASRSNPTDFTLIERARAEISILGRAQADGTQIDENRASNIFSSAESYALRAIEYDARNADNWAFLGNLYKNFISKDNEQFYQNSIVAFDKALEFRPNDPSIYLFEGEAALRKDDVALARSMGEKALSIKNNYGDAFVFLISLESSIENYKDAVRLAEAMVENIPSITSFQILGEVYDLSGDKTKARSAYETAYLLSGRSFELSNVLASFYSKYGINDGLDMLISDENSLRGNIDYINYLLGLKSKPVVEETSPEEESSEE